MGTHGNRRIIFLLALLFSMAVAGTTCSAESVQFVPWPYGLIAYVGFDPPQSDLQEDIARLTNAVESVCAFWGVDTPQCNSEWEDALDPKRAQCTPWFLPVRDVLPEGPNGPRSWSRCPISWDVGGLAECIVAIYTDDEALHGALGRYDFAAAFLPGGLYTDDGVRQMPGPLIAMTEGDFRRDSSTLLHEFTHWLLYDAAPRLPIPASNLRIVSEGAAERTEHSEGDHYDRWRIAAQFAQEGDLRHVPLSLLYPIGETVVDVMVEQGISMPSRNVVTVSGRTLTQWASVRCGASVQCPDWVALADEVEAAWLEHAKAIDDLTLADHVLYEAGKQRLRFVEVLLEPMLSRQARAVLDNIYEGRGLADSIEMFWSLVMELPRGDASLPEPETWEALRKREKTLSYVAIANARYAAPPAPESAAYAEMTVPDEDRAFMKIAYLIGLRELGLWDAYFKEYVSLVREIIAEGAVDPGLIPWWNPDSTDE
jgi:hypothetical protein